MPYWYIFWFCVFLGYSILSVALFSHLLMTSSAPPFSTLQASFDNLSAELKLLIKCWKDEPVGAEELNAVNWPLFLQLVKSHRMIGGLYPVVDQNEWLPIEVKEELKAIYNQNKLRMLTFTAELLHISKLFQKNDIASIALKGPMLSYVYHRDFMQRVCHDIDLLLEPTQIEKAYSILYQEGYRMMEESYTTPKQKEVYLANFHHYCLYHETKNIIVELHWRLLASQSIPTFPNAELWKNAWVAKVSGVLIQLLSKHDNFLYLCVHGGQHQWKRLFWLNDIVVVLQNEEAAFIFEAYHLAKQRGIGNYVLQALQLASALYKIILPSSMIDEIASKDSVSHLSKIALVHMNALLSLDEQEPFSLKTLRGKVSRFLMHYTSSYYYGDLKNVVHEAKAYFINPAYWSVFAFPDKVFLLNYVAAPFLWGYHFFRKFKKSNL